MNDCIGLSRNVSPGSFVPVHQYSMIEHNFNSLKYQYVKIYPNTICRGQKVLDQS